MKIGRNKPCPCGSGKKYKKCCLGNEKVSSHLLYSRTEEAVDRLMDGLMQHGVEVFGEDALGLALYDFMCWPEEGLSEDDLIDHEQLFYPWFFFNWKYENHPELPQLDGPEDVTIAELYATARANHMNRLEAQILEATVRQPYSFYEIQEIRPGEGYRLKDILCGTVSNVLEKEGSENARQGQILFARVVQINTVAMLMGCGTVLIPQRLKPELIRFRQWLEEGNDPIDSDTLEDYDIEIRDLYFELYDALTHPSELQNSDGDLMQSPELREQLRKRLFAYWENWVDEKIPALGDITPREAVKTADGRDSIEALLLDAGRHMDAGDHMREAGAAAIADVRRRLGLDKPPSRQKSRGDAGTKASRVKAVGGKIEMFCRSRLDPEHTDLALKLCEKIGRMRKPSIQRGRVEIWAAAIVHVIARLNFLFDPENEVYISADELNAFFGTKKATVSNKAGMILKSANLHLGDPDFSSAKIARMFSFHETEEGFIIPTSIYESIMNEQEGVEEMPSALANLSTQHKQKPEKPASKKTAPDKRKKAADDRQLKLFDDEP